MRRFLVVLVGIIFLVMPNVVYAEGEEPPPPQPPPPENQTIEAKALDDHECDDAESHFVITQVDDELLAPASIMVTWEGGQTEEVMKGEVTGKTVHYTTYSNLGIPITSASTKIYINWSGQFNYSHGPCANPPCPTPDPDPTPKPPTPPKPPREIPSTGINSFWAWLVEAFWWIKGFF